MASSLINEQKAVQQQIKDMSINNAMPSSPTQEEEMSALPLEVLRQTLDHLDNVVDLANVALVCQEWRELINTCDACWEKAFFRDYNHYNAEDYDSLPTWRQRYIACTLDITCLNLRDARHEYNATEEYVNALEIALGKFAVEAEKLKKNLLAADGQSTPILDEEIARYQKALDDQRETCDDAYKAHLSTLPLEVLHQSLDLLDNVADLGRVSLVCRNWRDVVYSHDAWWEKAFLRDYSEHNAEEYKTLPSWRQKYIACTLDETLPRSEEVSLQVEMAHDSIANYSREVEKRKRQLEQISKYGCAEDEDDYRKEIYSMEDVQKEIADYEEAINETSKEMYGAEIEEEYLQTKESSLFDATKYRPWEYRFMYRDSADLSIYLHC